MIRKEIEKRYDELVHDVVGGHLSNAIDTLKELIRQSTRSTHFYELTSIEDNYRNLLKYAYEGYADPQRDEILTSLSSSLLNLADKVVSDLTEEAYPERRKIRLWLDHKFRTNPSTVSSKIDELFFSHEVKELIEGENIPTSPVSEGIFKLIWLTPELKEHHINLIRHINQDKEIEWH